MNVINRIGSNEEYNERKKRRKRDKAAFDADLKE